MKNFKKIGYVGFGIIAVYLLMSLVFALTVKDISVKNPIIEFEFSQNTDDVINILTQEGEPFIELIDALDYINIIDFFYMTVYSVFLLLFFSNIQKITSDKIYYIPVFLSVIIFSADIAENIQLFNITDRLITYDFQDTIDKLQVFTRIKWLGITAVMLFASYYLYNKDKISKILAFLTALPLPIAIITLANKDYAEYYSLTVTIAFLSLIFYSYFYEKIFAEK